MKKTKEFRLLFAQDKDDLSQAALGLLNHYQPMNEKVFPYTISSKLVLDQCFPQCVPQNLREEKGSVKKLDMLFECFVTL